MSITRTTLSKRKIDDTEVERKVEPRYSADTTQCVMQILTNQKLSESVSMNDKKVLDHIKCRAPRFARLAIYGLTMISDQGVPVTKEMVNAVINAGERAQFFCEELLKLHQEGIVISSAMLNSLSVTNKTDATTMIIDLDKHKIPLRNEVIASGQQAIRFNLVSEHFIAFLMLSYTYFDDLSVETIASLFQISANEVAADSVARAEKIILKNQKQAQVIDRFDLVQSGSLPFPLEITKLVRSFFPEYVVMKQEQAEQIADYKQTMLGR